MLPWTTLVNSDIPMVFIIDLFEKKNTCQIEAFFGRIEKTKNCFWNYMTFNSAWLAQPCEKLPKCWFLIPACSLENFCTIHMTLFEVILKCHSLTLFKICLRLRPDPSKCLSERINWIISIIRHRISKNFKVQSGKITVKDAQVFYRSRKEG